MYLIKSISAVTNYNSSSCLITKLMIIVKTTPGMGVRALTAGSAACFADVITFPLDVVKVRKLIN